jgi:RNA 2',3'-cyclic 3'-phosphodiesterase
MSADRVRTFFAMWPDRPARESLAALARTVALASGGRPTREANLHVTVAFVGDVERAQIEALAECGEWAARSVASFPLALERLGGTRSGLAWIEPARVPDALAKLHAALAGALREHGFTIESRPFHPHVTLARKGVAAPPRRASSPIAWRVDHLALVASVTGGGASTYGDLARWTLLEA